MACVRILGLKRICDFDQRRKAPQKAWLVMTNIKSKGKQQHQLCTKSGDFLAEDECL